MPATVARKTQWLLFPPLIETRRTNTAVRSSAIVLRLASRAYVTRSTACIWFMPTNRTTSTRHISPCLESKKPGRADLALHQRCSRFSVYRQPTVPTASRATLANNWASLRIDVVRRRFHVVRVLTRATCRACAIKRFLPDQLIGVISRLTHVTVIPLRGGFSPVISLWAYGTFNLIAKLGPPPLRT